MAKQVPLLYIWRGGAGLAAGAVDLFHDHDASVRQGGAAVLLRNQRRSQPPAVSGRRISPDSALLVDLAKGLGREFRGKAMRTASRISSYEFWCIEWSYSVRFGWKGRPASLRPASLVAAAFWATAAAKSIGSGRPHKMNRLGIEQRAGRRGMEKKLSCALRACGRCTRWQAKWAISGPCQISPDNRDARG